MFDGLELRTYQEEALDKILECYDSGKTSALLIINPA